MAAGGWLSGIENVRQLIVPISLDQKAETAQEGGPGNKSQVLTPTDQFS